MPKVLKKGAWTRIGDNKIDAGAAVEVRKKDHVSTSSGVRVSTLQAKWHTCHNEVSWRKRTGSAQRDRSRGRGADTPGWKLASTSDASTVLLFGYKTSRRTVLYAVPDTGTRGAFTLHPLREIQASPT